MKSEFSLSLSNDSMSAFVKIERKYLVLGSFIASTVSGPPDVSPQMDFISEFWTSKISDPRT